MKRSQWWFVNGVAACAVLFAASMTSASQAENPAFTRVEGKVTFERRQTKVPMDLSVCRDQAHCVRSEAYWVVILTTPTATYELDRVFNRGSEVAPESVSLDEVVVRPGTELSMEGRAEALTLNYYLLSEIHDVNVVMDIGLPGADPSAQDLSSYQWEVQGNFPLYFGWTCKSAEPTEASANHLELHADVWYTLQHPGVGGYKLRVTASIDETAGRNVYQLAMIDNASAESDGTSVVYRGNSADGAAELSIEKEQDHYRNVPSVLKLSKIYSNMVTRVPLDSTVNMVCNLTR